jgi:hypothetical protein
MSLLAIILAVVAVIFVVWWGLVPTLQFLLWIAIALAIVAFIVFLIRYIRSPR